MALIGDTNFSMKPDVNMAAIASLYQKKATDEQNMKLQQSQIESQQQDRIMNVMKMATDLTQNLISTSAQNQIIQGRKNIQELLGQADQLVPSGQPGGEATLFKNPIDGSSEPKIQTKVPTASMIQTDQTPEFKNKLKSAILQASPTNALDDISKATFNPQQTKGEQIKQTMNPDGTVGYVRINVGTGEVQPIEGLTAPQGMNGQVNLTEEDRKNSVLNNMAKAIREGRALPGGLASLRTVNGQKAAALALEQDPNADLTLYPQRQQLRKDYTSNGAAGKSLTAFNTAIAHSEVVDRALNKLDNSQFPAWNKVSNKALVQTGDPRVGAFKVARNLFADEMAKAAQGGTGIITENERERQLESFDSASSPEQMKAVIDTTIQLMASKSKVLKDNWENTMKGITPAVPFVTSQAAKVLKSRGYDLNTLEQEPKKNMSSDLGTVLRSILPKR